MCLPSQLDETEKSAFNKCHKSVNIFMAQSIQNKLNKQQ